MNRLTMTSAEREDFLDQPRTAILSVAAPDGSVLSAPVWYLFRAPDTFLIAMEPGSRRSEFIQQVGRATITAQDEGDMRGSGRAPRYVSAIGSASFATDGMSPTEWAAYWDRYLPGGLRERYFARGGDSYMTNVAPAADVEPIEGVLVLTAERWSTRDYAKAGDRWDEVMGIPGAAEIGWEIS